MLDKMIFPTKNLCFFCKDETTYIEHFLCTECRSRIEEIHGEYELESPYIENCYASLFYNNFTRDFFHKFKFEDKSYLYSPFSSYMLKTIKENAIKDFDCIVAVPIHWRKESRRGYNQAYLLANEVGKSLNKPVLNTVLIKSKWTKEQNKLLSMQRRHNLDNSFSIKNKETIRGKKVLLIDDLVTTGTTLSLCAKELIEAGVDSVTGLVLISTKL
ncbi:MAG: ComF family protein [Gudongella sp.]|nr:ComF family protein [Gudongella sp.]